MFHPCRSGAFGSSIGLVSFLLLAPQLTAAQILEPVTPKMQVAADHQAFNAARKLTDPAQRLEADRQFLKDYPTSSLIESTHFDILQVLIKAFPDRTAEIDEQADYLAEHPGRNPKIFEDAYIASILADAGSKGVDLPTAEKWANAAIKAVSEASSQPAQAIAGKPAATPGADVKPSASPTPQHPVPVMFQVMAQTALATVYLDEDRFDDARPILDEAYTLSPTDSKISLLCGRLALAMHQNADALEDFESAAIMGGIHPPWRETMMSLYRQAHAGSDAGFLHDMDARYAKLFPMPFVPAKHEPHKSGHTVLLEFFTGSGCIPCVGGDLATDALMDSYGRDEVVELELDQHIPDPDPLANPDTVERAAADGTGSMPAFLLDGMMLPLQGASRADSGSLYAKLAAAVDGQETKSSSVALKLGVERASDGAILAKAEVIIGSMEELDKYLAEKIVAEAASIPGHQNIEKARTPVPVTTTTDASKEKGPPNLVLHFALVEDNVRYTGENGVRFHRMVVRAIPGNAMALQSQALVASSFETTFHPAEISAKWATYLDSYEKDHDPFHAVEFLSKDTTIDPVQLAVVAWVQDTTSHRVLQTQFVPVVLGK
jgi:tetratricopeptide (TPR) repeat protein